MHMPPPYLEPEEPLEPTVFEDLVAACTCDTRYAILCCLIPGPLRVSAIVELLGFSQPHVSNHLRALRGGKLVVAQSEKKLRPYRLGPAVRATREPGRTRLMLHADDGSELLALVPDTARVCRSFTPALWERLEQVTPPAVTSVTVIPRDGVRTPRGSGKTPLHPPTKP
jgi:DNA-binding transcriptional ArsR family regulator